MDGSADGNAMHHAIAVSPGVAGAGHFSALLSGSVPELRKTATKPRRYLVFTSAGDRHTVPAWLAATRDFDLWVAWYGQGPDILESGADYYLRRAGSKFQNLHYCFQRWPDLFDRYEAVMVMDDDIGLSPSKIGTLFALRRQYDLWALQPAFSPMGKLSYHINRVQRECLLRFVDFIEMTCPLFRTDKLCDFLRVYDPELVGWGCDWWYMHTMGPDLRERVAIIDAVVCVNPRDSWKPGGVREIDILQSAEKRRATWLRIRDSRGILGEADGPHEFRALMRPIWSRWVMRAFGVAERATVRIVDSGHRKLESWMDRESGKTSAVADARSDHDSCA